MELNPFQNTVSNEAVALRGFFFFSVSSVHYSKPIESYKKHLPSQWTPDLLALGLDSNVAPWQQEQSWGRELRSCWGL